jgi:hypothetical protein
VTLEQWTDWLTLPEGARWLTEAELSQWNDWLDGDWMRRQFLNSAYARPEDVDLWKLFYMGVDLREVSIGSYDPVLQALTDEDKRACLLHLGSISEARWTDRLPRSQMDALLRKYLGLGLDETARRGAAWPYLPETDSFVHSRNEGNWRSWPLRYGYALGDETCLFYMAQAQYLDAQSGTRGWSNPEGVFRVVLRQAGDEVHFVSNQRALTNGTDFAYEAPELTEAYPADYSGDSGQDIMVVAPEPEIFGSYEEALAATEAIAFHMGEDEEYPISISLQREYPGYGTLIYGTISAGLPHGAISYFIFITEDGRRFYLPTPFYGLGDYDMDWTEDGSLAEIGGAFALREGGEDTVRWWFLNKDKGETYPALGLLPKAGGRLDYTLWLPTMEVFIWYRPEE